MIICVVGTRAQLIKMAPVLAALESAGTPYQLVLTGQHKATMDELLAEFQVRGSPQHLYDGEEIKGIAQMGIWLLRVLWRGLTTHRQLFRLDRTTSNCVVVHGDTFSTLLGALLGKWHGLDVVHVEAGLTSGRWREPFPEELTRRIIFRLSDVAFCAGEWAVGNMRLHRAECIDTGANTIVDAVRMALACAENQAPRLNQDGPYAVVSLHRFENIFQRERLEFIVAQLERIAARVNLAFVLHPATRAQCEKFALLARLESNAGISLLARMTYIPFQQLLAGSCFVITDGGSNQEELSLLGIPTLLMRGATERQEGLGTNVVLSRYDAQVIDKFVDDALATNGARELSLSAHMPALQIAEELHSRYVS
jgi:UDP-N-acetylglucosamine 2-epimerase (non-hydrolysing)